MIDLFKFLTKHYPFYKGRGRLALSNFRRAPSNQLILETLKTGEYIYIFPNDYIGRMIYFFGDFDPAITMFIKQVLKKGDVVVDIGSNLGVVTLVAASIVSNSGRVISFEPNEIVGQALTKSISRNNFTNIELHVKALSDIEGTQQLLVPINSYGRAKISSQGNASCTVTRLDNFSLTEHSTVRLIKIDVEGHESKVLHGGLKFVEKYSPEIILFESHPEKGIYWNRDEVILLNNLQYSFYELRRNFLYPKLVKVPLEHNYNPTCYDFVAVKNEKVLIEK